MPVTAGIEPGFTGAKVQHLLTETQLLLDDNENATQYNFAPIGH